MPDYIPRKRYPTAGSVQGLDTSTGSVIKRILSQQAVDEQFNYESIERNAIWRYNFDAKGDLLVGAANDTVVREPVGANNYVLTADSAMASGVKWAPIPPPPPPPVTSVNGRTGAVTGLQEALGYTPVRSVTATGPVVSSGGMDPNVSLSYTPANIAGDTFTGDVHVAAGACMHAPFYASPGTPTEGAILRTRTGAFELSFDYDSPNDRFYLLINGGVIRTL